MIFLLGKELKSNKEDIMKIRSFVSAILGVALVASCTGKVSEVTEITGVVVPEGIDEVAVVVGTAVDTLVPVTDGKFSITVPTDLTVMAVVAAGECNANFIADGTPLEVVLDAESVVTSKYPKVSVQEKLNVFDATDKAYGEEFSSERQSIMADTLLTDEQKQAKYMESYESFVDKYVDYNVQVAQENTDNFIALFALRNLNGLCDDEQMKELLAALAPALQDHSFVKGLQESIDARLATAPGQMFKDFTVNTVVGQTRSIPPQPKYAELKLSDYVGKGKYVLLDFWAPWCGPCRREMPNIKTVYEKYADKGLEVVSIAVWERQPVEITINTAAQLGMTWPQINNAGSEPAALYGVESIPHLILFGPDGTILKRGFHGLDGIEAAVAEYLE